MVQHAMLHSSLGMPCVCPSQRRATQSRAPVTCRALQQPRTMAMRPSVKAHSFFSKLRQDSSSAGTPRLNKSEPLSPTPAAGVYGSQGRDEYSEEDVADYFAYIGLLAVEGNYDSMDAIVASASLCLFPFSPQTVGLLCTQAACTQQISCWCLQARRTTHPRWRSCSRQVPTQTSRSALFVVYFMYVCITCVFCIGFYCIGDCWRHLMQKEDGDGWLSKTTCRIWKAAPHLSCVKRRRSRSCSPLPVPSNDALISGGCIV